MTKALQKTTINKTAGDVVTSSLKTASEFARRILGNPGAGLAAGLLINHLAYKTGVYDPRSYILGKTPAMGYFRIFIPPQGHFEPCAWRWQTDTEGIPGMPGLDILALLADLGLPPSAANELEYQYQQETGVTSIYYHGTLIWRGVIGGSLGTPGTGHWEAAIVTPTPLGSPPPGLTSKVISGGVDASVIPQPVDTWVVDSAGYMVDSELVIEGSTIADTRYTGHWSEWVRTVEASRGEEVVGYWAYDTNDKMDVNIGPVHLQIPKIIPQQTWVERRDVERAKEVYAQQIANLASVAIAVASVIYAFGSKANETQNIDIEK